jgi:DNA helicase IV
VRHGGDEITPAVLRLVRNFLNQGLEVVLLSRRNGVPWYVNFSTDAGMALNPLSQFLEHVRSFLPEEDRGRVSISTAHSFKGLEKPAVIVLDAVQRSYPLIHPHWVFLRVFGDSIDSIVDEERRLFYVAVTRAKDSLALITETPRESPFLDDIGSHATIYNLSWEDLHVVPSLDGPHIEIRVSNAFNVKDQLKDLRFRWNSEGQYWYKAVFKEGFSFDRLIAQPWVTGGVKVQVYDENGDLLYSR